MEPNVKKLLSAEAPSEVVQKLTGKINALLRTSRNTMSKHYKKWDMNLAIYRGERVKDVQDYEARDANEPEKFIVPMSYAQVQTFLAFGFLLYTQNKNFFEFEATGNEDFPIGPLLEKGLSRDLQHNRWNTKLYQHLLDLARTSLAPIKVWWAVDTQTIDVTIPGTVENTELGTIPMAPITTTKDAIKYEGNKIQNISPYHFLPDTRLPMARWREGTFVADEDQWHISNVKALEDKDLAAGTEFILPMTKELWKNRGESRLGLVEALVGLSAGKIDDQDFMSVVTEGNIRLKPSDYEELLGSDNKTCLYTFRLCNDRLISLDKQGCLHDEFNYVVGQFSSDQEAQLSEGLCDTIKALQETITWLYNSRMTSVRRSLDSHLIVHPQYVEISDLESRSPIVKLKKNAPVNDIKNIVHQLDIRDTTTGHFNDADVLRQTMQVITGINDNSMGQVASGRRSATENRAANSGASGRLKMTLACNWDNALGPLGRMMMINQRQGLSQETFTKVFGKSPDIQALYPEYCPEDPEALIGNEDFCIFDSTLTSEKGFIAQSLQELVVAMVSNPEMAMASGFNLEAAMLEIQSLRGVTNATRFFTAPAPQPSINGLGNPAGLPSNLEGVEGEPALSAVAA